MRTNRIIKELGLKPDKKEIERIRKKSKEIINFLRKRMKKNDIRGDIFIGGSFAKGTLMKEDFYDIDIFLRLECEEEQINFLFEKIMEEKIKWKELDFLKVRGSRRYYRIIEKKDKIVFEIIPVLKIKKPEDAKNTTDLSYFHVAYVKKEINEKMINEILIAKAFCKAAGVYGAESFINGFSGYAIECLIINYKTFKRMLKNLIKEKEKIILDPRGYYKNEKEILLKMNENKIRSKIVLIDPTYKERNILASLSNESFEKFKKRAEEYLKNPSLDFFKRKEVKEEELEKEAKKENCSFLKIKIICKKQEGDIAGTKMKKFNEFLLNEIKKYFEIRKNEFLYFGKDNAVSLFILKKRERILKKGPMIWLKRNCEEFKKKNKVVFKKGDRLYALINLKKDIKEYINEWIIKNRKKIEEKGIEEVLII